MKRVIVATKNKGKKEEIRELFKDYFDEFISIDELDKEINIIENGNSFEENAFIKAKVIYDLFHMPTLADDSGLMVDLLNGEPGIYSARYAGEDSNDKKNMEKLLDKLRDTPENNRTAKFVCVFVFIDENGNILKSRGECHGKIAFEPKGNNGFGYDPIFIPYGFDKTFAELSDNVKNSISHRFNAAIKLKKLLEELYEDFSNQ
ncbi:XTP/dITP diphosphatase [Caldicellulosiruptoraceae bacterium PP1]